MSPSLKELEALYELVESTVTYIKQCYEKGLDEDIKDDVLDLIEQVLQYGVLVLEVTDERVDAILGTLRQLASVMKNQNAIGTSRRRGRPEIDVGEELSYLLEQGFRTKDISTMFGCSSRTIQRRMKKYELSHLNSVCR